jgi:predicted GNAT superfamily acetyltransferase
MKIEKQNVTELLARCQIRTLQPDDYTEWVKIAESAWGQININQSWDFTALTKDNIASVGITDGNKLIGASLNIIKAGDDDYLLVHMLGVTSEYQNVGLGKKLMEANYDLIRLGRLKNIATVKLTSDPLDSRNVRLYLHKCKMHANQYLEDAYRGLSESGGEKHIGLPSDRLYYVSHPQSLWVNSGVLPTSEQYQLLLEKYPKYLDPGSHAPIIFVETPEDLETFKKDFPEEALNWRQSQRNIFELLFSRGYTAVDHTIINHDNSSRFFIVCSQGFDESNPKCLLDQLNSI